ncbi:MAG: hypothetical protein PHP50_05580 [Lachnospiraceae bacterium]|nr:hypothetical protein [Lachnospiraceae bacterium]
MKPIHDFYEFNYNKTKYRFLPTGDIFDFTYDNIMMNQFCSNPKDGSVSNLYLRIYKENTITAYPLLGVRSHSALKKGKDTLVSYGIVEDIIYEVTFRGTDKLWFWEIELSGKGEVVDLLYGQDIGNASIKNVLTNELYTAQYLGHTILPSEAGYVVCSRQNQEQEGKFPYIQQGTLGIKAIHYSTDGFQFFGTSYKTTDRPEILSKDLPDVNYQFEFSYIGLQTEKICLDSSKQAMFYGLFQENHEDVVTEIENLDRMKECYTKLLVEEELVSCDKIKVKDIFGETYSSIAIKKEEIYELFPNHILEEQEEDVLLSFFTDKHSHIVTMQKELMTERPHGTIITTCIDTKEVNSNLITSTNYMMGLFQGQTAIGNTSFHKFLSAPRV